MIWKCSIKKKQSNKNVVLVLYPVQH